MPRGRSRNNPVQETSPEEQALREQTPPAGPEQEQASVEPEAVFTAPAGPEAPEHPSLQTAEEAAPSHEESATAPNEPRQEESSDTLLGYMAENFREDILYRSQSKEG